MANYYANSRTSYAKMKDVGRFEKWAEKIPGAEVIRADHKDHGVLHGFLFDEGIPSCVLVGGSKYDAGDYEDFHIYEEIQDHLAKGWSMTFMEAGAEASRYVVGFAAVVTTATIDIMDMSHWAENKVKELGCEGTRCEY
jgi:hypothetical protein